MLTGITRLFCRVQKLDLRCFSHMSAQAPQSNPVPAECPRSISRTSDSDPAKHGEQHEGQFYSIPLQDLKTVFPHGLPPRYMMQSTYNRQRFDQPLEASTWLKNFKTTNKHFLSQIKVQGKYIWNKRESTEKGSPLGEVVEQGITRVRNATDAVGIVLKELRSQSSEGHFRLLVAVDGVNALWGRTTLKREDRTLIAPEELSLVHSLRKMVKNDWEGFDALDPFLPILISNYNPKEFESSFQYYLENNWLQHEKAPTEEGRKELKFLSNCNPGQLERLCAAL
ncbi:hypothetical protein U0070_009201 [Myodes glareolus]|uniref:Small ribosomal subunit protein mS29 n=1 Tax=Myodes glareolus TaxID=447135 RepID=A0AAW0HCQ1_MYOGA